MGKIFYVMGKSASGKDTIYKQLHARMPELKTVRIPPAPSGTGKQMAWNISLWMTVGWSSAGKMVL